MSTVLPWFRNEGHQFFPSRLLTPKLPVSSLTPGTGSLSCGSGCFKYLALMHTLALLNCFSSKMSAEKQFNESGYSVTGFCDLKTLCFCKFKYQYKLHFSEQKVCHKLRPFINFLLFSIVWSASLFQPKLRLPLRASVWEWSFMKKDLPLWIRAAEDLAWVFIHSFPNPTSHLSWAGASVSASAWATFLNWSFFKKRCPLHLALYNHW